MDITFTINATLPDGKATEILEKVTTYLGYQAMIDDGQGTMIPNPQTRKQYIEQKLKEHIKNIYTTVRANEGAESGKAVALAEADTEIQ